LSKLTSVIVQVLYISDGSSVYVQIIVCCRSCIQLLWMFLYCDMARLEEQQQQQTSHCVHLWRAALEPRMDLMVT